MLTLGLRSYRSSNLVIDLKMWEKFETNLPVCKAGCTYVGEVRERFLIPIQSEALQKEGLEIGADTTNL